MIDFYKLYQSYKNVGETLTITNINYTRCYTKFIDGRELFHTKVLLAW